MLMMKTFNFYFILYEKKADVNVVDVFEGSFL